MKTVEAIAEVVVEKYKNRQPLNFGDIRHAIFQFRSELSREGYHTVYSDHMEYFMESQELRAYTAQHERLTNAVKALNDLIGEAKTDSEVVRLMGKREGVNLALSYVNENIRRLEKNQQARMNSITKDMP
jgi:hypothetical protein